MRVKRLEIQGFKSFKDKTVIHFDHSITGIVGPNGCGKSNIVDAFFWVMGEQSYKHMRGNSSEDLIFNGSSKYSPLGMAEATLVMETETVDLSGGPSGATAQDLPPTLKSKEVSVTRKLYRSGEGEYFINGVLARLKDIQELFMDTGVGAKGYSVIEQGQIGKIVNAKPDERRLLIEEAAGIAKYKARKKESLRKMEATQANLARLTDIIQEIEKTLASLDRQAQKARQYKKYKDELFDKEMTWGRRKSQIFKEKLETLRKRKEELEHSLSGLKAELQTSENSTEVDRIRLLTETKEAESLQSQIQDLAQDLSHEKSALDLSRRRQGDLASQLEALVSEKAELESVIEADTVRLAENETEAKEANELFKTTQEEARLQKEALDKRRKETEKSRSSLDFHQKTLLKKIQEVSHLTSKDASLSTKADTAKIQSEKLSSQIENQNERILFVQSELEQSQSKTSELKQQRELLLAEKREQGTQVQTLEQELRQQEKEKNDAHRALTQLKSRLQSLEELDQSHEGLGDGPKAALEWARSQGKSPDLSILTDALQVKSGYEAVLECWLEKRIESLILKDSSLVLPLLEEIKKKKQGRISVRIPSLSAHSDPAVSQAHFKKVKEFLEDKGFKTLGELSEFVSPSESDLSQLQSLVSSVCVVETSAPFVLLLQEQNLDFLNGWSIVSMDGVVLEAEGLLRGGSLDTTGAVGILKRKRSIEELKIQVLESETAYQSIESAVSEAKQSLDIQRARLQSLQGEIQSLEIQVAALDRDVHQTEKAYQEAKSHLAALEREAQHMTLEVERALEDRETIQIQLTEFLTERHELETTISESQKGLMDLETELRAEDQKLQTVRVKEATLQERAVSLKRESDATQSLILDRKRRIIEVQRTLDRASQEHDQFSGGESELIETVERLTFELAATREKLSLFKDQIEQSNAKINSTLERIKILHKSGDHQTNEANQLALEIEKTSGDLTHLVLNLEEKYGPGCLTPPLQSESQDPSQALESSSTPLSPEEEAVLSEEVERLRERIRRLGEVNVMAIEEYEQLKKRYDHLLSEREDLQDSLKNLQEAIEHINKTSEERFRKAFEAIADRFERLFPIIFGGGQAKLSLVYPEGSSDILEAGVDILAQPPGKKVANITLLSGGEKALTAVSLIFAIFMVKPSPFCVLDEVDAPLDDANIGKFNALLREMSIKSQFILITHNKKTMELNDTLYGVTMEEPGVSKMVSIEMN